MEQNYVNPLPFKHISTAASEAVTYIRRRKNHEIEPLKSRWNKFNEMCCGGIEPGCVYTIVGASGTGKSSFVNTLETDLIELNSNKELVVLSFSFEMLSRAQVGRKLSNKLRQTTTQLYSASEDLSDKELNLVEETAESLKDYPIYYVDDAATVQKIDDTITYFQNTIAKDKWLIVILDHTLLVNSDNYKDERMSISELERVFIKAKKSSAPNYDAFWERENKANRVRKKPLDNLDYISIPITSLPIQKNTTDEELLEVL